MKQIFNITNENVGKRLDIFLEQSFDNYSRSKIKRSIDNGEVLVNLKQEKAGYKLRLNDNISCEIIEDKTLNAIPENINLDIVFENDNLLVVNKPSGMVVHPACGNYSGTLVNALCFYTKNLSHINGEFRPGIVHRLDKDTSGLLIVAKNDWSHKILAEQIKTKVCKRYYIALLEGNLKQESGQIETNLVRSAKNRKLYEVCSAPKGKKAITLFKVKEHFNGYTLCEFELKTGRTHQIRVHSKYLGHPIVADNQYGFKNHTELNGQLLHAYKLEFFEPSTNEKIVLECPLPQKFVDFMDKIK